MIRKYQPEMVLSNALHDRHPDHGRAGDLVYDASFLSGLAKVKTFYEDVEQQAWRPNMLLQYIQDRYIEPDILIDVTEFWDKKMESVHAFSTQFFNPENDGEGTYISSPEFLMVIEARAREFGKYIGATYAEGFTSKKYLGVDNLFLLR